jgi:hypothetical protein
VRGVTQRHVPWRTRVRLHFLVAVPVIHAADPSER